MFALQVSVCVCMCVGMCVGERVECVGESVLIWVTCNNYYNNRAPLLLMFIK